MDKDQGPIYDALVPHPAVCRLIDRGVEIPHPEHVFIGDEVSLEAIEAGVRLDPGSRIEGSRTRIGAGSHLAFDGPVVLRDCALGRNVRLASGTFRESLFHDGVSVGPAAQVRSGTIMEEGASAAHAVGLKQTILLPFVVLGSNVNFCDALLAGGTGRDDHSEVGSGFIHFNFTPFGPRGDKATASLFGDVTRGVWLREKRIFLGGSGGVVGPVQIGYGTVLAAGSVYRSDREEDLLVLGESLPGTSRPFEKGTLRRVLERVRKNLRYMAEVAALDAFYAEVRRRLVENDPLQRDLVAFGRGLLRGALAERRRQLLRLGEGLPAAIRALERKGCGAAVELQDLRQATRLLEAPLPETEDLLRETGAGDELARLVESSPGAGLSCPQWVRALPVAGVTGGRDALERVTAAWLRAVESF